MDRCWMMMMDGGGGVSGEVAGDEASRDLKLVAPVTSLWHVGQIG